MKILMSRVKESRVPGTVLRCVLADSHRTENKKSVLVFLNC